MSNQNKAYPFAHYVNKGTAVSGTGAITVAAPANVRQDDLLLLLIENENSPIVLGTNGTTRWTEMNGSPIFDGTANTSSGCRLGVYWRMSPNTAPGSQAVTDTSGHQFGIMIAIRGVANTAPYAFLNAFANSVSASSTNVQCPSVVTTAPYTTILNLIGNNRDLASSNVITSWTKAPATANAFEIHDQTVSTTQGGGIAVFYSHMVEAGVTGNTSGTADASAGRVNLTIALNTYHRRRVTKFR